MLLYRSLIAFGRVVLFYFIVASFVSPGWAKQKKQQRESDTMLPQAQCASSALSLNVSNTRLEFELTLKATVQPAPAAPPC
jgi:hypothetical protein